MTSSGILLPLSVMLALDKDQAIRMHWTALCSGLKLLSPYGWRVVFLLYFESKILLRLGICIRKYPAHILKNRPLFGRLNVFPMWKSISAGDFLTICGKWNTWILLSRVCKTTLVSLESKHFHRWFTHFFLINDSVFWDWVKKTRVNKRPHAELKSMKATHFL